MASGAACARAGAPVAMIAAAASNDRRSISISNLSALLEAAGSPGMAEDIPSGVVSCSLSEL